MYKKRRRENHMKETIATATVTLEGNTVRLTDPAIFLGENHHTFNTREEALAAFDHTCDTAAFLHGCTRPLPEPPNFAACVNL